MCTVHGVELHVGPGQPYASITAALAVAGDDAVITVHAGTYVEPQLNLTQRNLLLRAYPDEARPVIVSTSGQFSNMIIINADGITIRGFEITHQQGDQYGYGIGDADGAAARSGWTVEQCIIHNCRSAVYNNKMSNFTFRHNEVYMTYSAKLKLDATESFVCIGNFFRESTRPDGMAPAISWHTGGSSSATGDTLIMYNYMHGGRIAIYIVAQGDLTPSGSRTLTIAHNTLDGQMGAWGVGGDYASSLISLWENDGPGYSFASDKITIRDNIFVASHWYAIVNGGSTHGLAGNLVVENSLFFENFSNDLWYPGLAFENEWPGPRGEVGWLDRGDDFVFTDCLIADPSLARAGTTADEYYAIDFMSPAHGAASNGSNIGAWQPADPGPYTALTTWHGNGSISPSNPQTLWYGNVTFLIAADSDTHHISGIEIDGVIVYTNTAERGIASTNFTVFAEDNFEIHASFSPSYTVSGIPLEWLSGYGISNLNDAVESMDLDGDGFSVLEEYIADTHPQDATSFFPPLQMAGTASNLIFTINPTSAQRLYHLDMKTDLTQIDWVNVTNAFGTGGMLVIEYAPPPSPPYFFRSRVTLPP